MLRGVSGAIENNETYQFFQFGEPMPFRESAHVIFADQAVDRCTTVVLSNLLNRVDRIRGRWAAQLACVHGKPRFAFNRCMQYR